MKPFQIGDVTVTSAVEAGEALAYATVDFDSLAAVALKACASKADRKALRASFVVAYAKARNVSEKAANNRFDYMARIYSPTTSRKARANSKRKPGAGRKPKQGGEAKQVDTAKANAAAVAFCRKAMRANEGDSDMLEMLGAIVAILAGQRAK